VSLEVAAAIEASAAVRRRVTAATASDTGSASSELPSDTDPAS